MSSRILCLPLLLFFFISTVSAATSVTQYGITWTFNGDYQTGQFANGDWWVVGPVTITRITPDFDGQHHGWMANMSSEQQGYDNRAHNFDASLVPSLPYTAQPGTSIVKAVSRELSAATCRPCLDTAAVLTVLASAPPGNGAGLFRPPFIGTEKPFYAVNDLHLENLPSLEPPPGSEPSTFDWIETRFKRVQLDVDSYPGENIRPCKNMTIQGYCAGTSNTYGSRVAYGINDAALRFMLNDSQQEKLPDLIYFVQAGIDYYHMMKTGLSWEGNGGHGPGRKLPIILTAILFEDQSMKNLILSQPTTTFQEDDYIYYSPVANNGQGVVLFGGDRNLANIEYTYWWNLVEDGHNRTAADPYGYIDGGHVPGTSYQLGNNTLLWKAPVIAMSVMPEVNYLWNNPLIIEYLDRWVTYGTWAQPDPCAPAMGICVGGPRDGQVCTYNNEEDTPAVSESEAFCGDGDCAAGVCDAGSPFAGQACSLEAKPAQLAGVASNACGNQPNGNYYRCQPNPVYYGVTYGPNGSGGCILDQDASDGIGRFPLEDGLRANEGGYESPLVAGMWDLYRHEHCHDGQKNFDETGVDCGGSCIQDLDGDLYYVGRCNPGASEDCDDSDSHVNPGAAEVCTKEGEVDDDCDGLMHSSYYQDSDSDSVNDCEDNCVNDSNPSQADSDYDGIGDACDSVFELYEDFEEMADGDYSYRHTPNGLSFEDVAGTASVTTTNHWGYNSRHLHILSCTSPCDDKLIVSKEGRGTWDNYTLDITAGHKYTHNGIVLHYQDAQNYYVLMLRGDNGNLKKVQNGVETFVAGTGDNIQFNSGGSDYEFAITSTMDGTFQLHVEREDGATRDFIDANPHVSSGSIGFFVEGGDGGGNYFIADNIGLSFESEPQCVTLAMLMGDISSWKQGQLSMVGLMQRISQWKSGSGC